MKKQKKKKQLSLSEFANDLGLDPVVFTNLYNKWTARNDGSRTIDFDDVRKTLNEKEPQKNK